VTSLDSFNPEVATALSILDDANRSVQGEGWNFNTEYKYPFVSDVNGDIFVPNTVLQIADNKIANVQKYQTVLRQGRLYDKINHTYTFPANTTIYCDVIWAFDFEDLPQIFKDYITIKATRIFYDRVAGDIDAVKFKIFESDEGMARANCLSYDTQTSEANIFGIETGQNYYISFTPYRALSR
jgi:hypothetical protein